MPVTYVNIASTVLGSAQATITFSSIPQTYTDLMLRYSARANSGSTQESVSLYLNNDTTSTIYTSTYLEWYYQTITSVKTTNGINGAFPLLIRNSGAAANNFGSAEFYLPSYTTTIAKQALAINTVEQADLDGNMRLLAQRLNFTSAVNRLDLKMTSGASFVSGSSFYLYGIKNS